MNTTDPEIDMFVECLFASDPMRFENLTFAEMMRMWDRELALRILGKCWELLYSELDDEPSSEEMRGWQVLVNARRYLEAQS